MIFSITNGRTMTMRITQRHVSFALAAAAILVSSSKHDRGATKIGV
jgi:hypothetical protein